MSSKTCRAPCSFLLEYSGASPPTRRSLRGHRSAGTSCVHVVVVTTHADDSLLPLLYCCAILDINVRVIGWKEELKGPREGWRAQKILDLCEELDEDEVVVVLDRFLGLALQQKDVILEKFQEFRGRIVCMALKTHQDLEQRSFWSRFGRRKSFEADARSHSAGGRAELEPHAGAFIGYAGKIVRVLAKAHQDNLSIQALFSSLYRGKPDDLVSIDENCSIFHQCHSSRSIRVLSYAEAHAQAMHQSPQFLSSSVASSVKTPSSTPLSASHTGLPHSSHLSSSFSSSSSSSTLFVSPCSGGVRHASPTSPECSTTLSHQQSCAARPAPFFRPSPLQKIAMDAATGETPCFLHFSDSACANAVLREFEFFTHSREHPQQWPQQEHLRDRHCQRHGLLRKHCRQFHSIARTYCCRRLHATYTADSILLAFLLISLLVIGVTGVHTLLAHSGHYRLLPGSFISFCKFLFQSATALASRGLTCCLAPIMQAFHFVENVTTFWLSIFVSCCLVGLCGAACCGSSKTAEEQIFSEWPPNECFELSHQPMPGVGTRLTGQERWRQLRQEGDQQHPNAMERDTRERKKDEAEQQALAEKLRVEERASLGREGKVRQTLRLAVHSRGRSSSRRQQQLHQQGLRQELRQLEGAPQQLLVHKAQENKQPEQEKQAPQQQRLPQVLHEKGHQSFQQHSRERHLVSQTRVRRGKRSRVRVDSQQGKQTKVTNRTGATADCASLVPPPPSVPVAPRRTRSTTRRAAEAAVTAGS